MGVLYDQGNFKFEDKVSKHWPEFAKNGKENIRICDVLRHESGLPWFSEIPEKTEMMWTENIKKNKIGEFIENQTPHWPQKPGKPNSKFQYHSLTRGVILNEIIRRIGKFFNLKNWPLDGFDNLLVLIPWLRQLIACHLTRPLSQNKCTLRVVQQ